jgi:magnesium-transporting ATPase (P-type)
MKKIFACVSLGLILAVATLSFVPIVQAADTTTQENIDYICSRNPSASICADWQDPNAEEALNTSVNNIINIMLYVAGMVAVIMIIVSALRWTSSRGDKGNVEKARSTLMYSVAGLVVVILAWSIVNFVIGRI